MVREDLILNFITVQGQTKLNVHLLELHLLTPYMADTHFTHLETI
jgi:hypothetical protein